MKNILLTLSLIGLAASAFGQKYMTKAARISFYSKAPLENIEAVNKTGACLIDTRTGVIQFVVLIKGFEFRKALMQEHFNENYLESDKYPRSEFKGTIVNNGTIDYGKPGSYPVTVKGQLTIHGITKDTEAEGVFVINDKLEINSEFMVRLSDYNISIPSLVKDNISNIIKVSISAKLDLFQE